MQKQRKGVRIVKIEVRNGAATIEGYVNVTERLSKPIRDVRGQFLEKVATGAFNSALQRNDNVELRFNHRRKLGDQQDGSLELREDNIGLYAKGFLPIVLKIPRNFSFPFSSINMLDLIIRMSRHCHNCHS